MISAKHFIYILMKVTRDLLTNALELLQPGDASAHITWKFIYGVGQVD